MGLEILAPENAHRGGGAGLHAGEDGVGTGKAVELAVKERQGIPEGTQYIAGQRPVQGAPGHPGAVSGRYGPGTMGGPGGQKIPHGLGGSAVVPAAQGEGGLLPAALEGHTRQGMVGAEVLRPHPHQEAAVDVLAVSGPVTHAVGHKPPLLRGGGHHLAAGTHAEGEGRPARGQMAGELIVGGGQRGPGASKLGAAHRLLAVLDAHADGEGLALHAHTRLKKHFKGVPGRVAGGEHQGLAGQGVGTASGHDGDARQGAAPDVQTAEPVLKADVRPQGHELLAHGDHHLPQHVGAHMGLVGVADVLRRAVGDEGVQYMGDAAVVGTGG